LFTKISVLNSINKKNFFFLIVISFFFKVLFSYFYGDYILKNEWEILYKNLVDNKILSYNYINGEAVPNLYMPILYVLFLYPFSILNLNIFYTVKTILLFQCVLSSLSVYYFYKFCLIFFEKKKSILAALIFLFYPLNFYTSSLISSVTLQNLLFILFLYYLHFIDKNKNYILFAVYAALLILIRGEFLLLYIILLLYFLFFSKYYKKVIFSFLITIIIISPYIIRNYQITKKITIVSSLGYNLWKGNNEKTGIDGVVADHIITKKYYEDKNNIFYSIYLETESIKNKLFYSNQLYKYDYIIDQYYLKLALNNIFEEPKKYFFLYLKKLFAYIFFNFDSNVKNYYNILSIMPEVLISIFSIFGVFKGLKHFNNIKFIYFIYFFYIFFIPAFSILPRYKLFILPFLIFFSLLNFEKRFIVKKH
jgi:hypothetical protein